MTPGTRDQRWFYVEFSDPVLIGDTEPDIEAAQTIGTPSIGYANKSGKAAKLKAAGADAVVASIDEIVARISRSSSDS